jgi:hypothetical protein
MWTLAVLCFIVAGLTSAFPTLPSSLLEQPIKQDNGPRVFMVQVSEPHKEEKDQPKREFPWPYPPVFESFLPSEIKQRLTTIYLDQKLSSEERATQTNAVFDSLPQEIVEALPLPDEYQRLPFDVYQRIQYVHVVPGFKWAERQQLIRDIVESLPAEEKHLMEMPRIGGPPSGFEFVLAPTVYKQLLFVHHNPRLSKAEKSEMITRIMRQVPQEQIQQLPLPSGMDQLPMGLQARARALVYDYSAPQPIRAQRVKEFIQSLPEQIRVQLR